MSKSTNLSGTTSTVVSHQQIRISPCSSGRFSRPPTLASKGRAVCVSQGNRGLIATRASGDLQLGLPDWFPVVVLRRAIALETKRLLPAGG